LVRVIKPTREEKTRLWRIPYIFMEKQVTPQALSEYSSLWGLHSRFLEIMFWQLDTLYLLSQGNDLVWKGGTCVQSYLEPEYQRYSVDIDLNTSLEREGIIRLIDEINSRIMRDEKFVELNGIRIGLLNLHSENRVLGVLNYYRLVPCKHGGEYSYRGEIKILGVIPIRVQINYGYHKKTKITALNITMRKPGLAPSRILNINFVFPHASREDLLADKLLAMVEVKEKHRGRVKIKDAYDILSLIRTNKLDFGVVKRKIDVISESWGIGYDLAVKKSLEALEKLSEYALEVLGLRGSVGHRGYVEIVSKWRIAIKELIGFLRGKL